MSAWTCVHGHGKEIVISLILFLIERVYRRLFKEYVTRRRLTRGSDVIILNASFTAAADAPPPTSKKLAGSPPCNFMMSIVAIAKPSSVNHATNITIKRDVIQIKFSGVNLFGVFLRPISQGKQVFLPEFSVVVESALAVQCEICVL